MFILFVKIKIHIQYKNVLDVLTPPNNLTDYWCKT